MHLLLKAQADRPNSKASLLLHKIYIGSVSLNFNEFFEFANTKTTRGHEYKLFKPRCIAAISILTFSVSVSSTVNFSSPSAFKRSLQNVNSSASVRSS